MHTLTDILTVDVRSRFPSLLRTSLFYFFFIIVALTSLNLFRVTNRLEYRQTKFVDFIVFIFFLLSSAFNAWITRQWNFIAPRKTVLYTAQRLKTINLVFSIFIIDVKDYEICLSVKLQYNIVITFDARKQKQFLDTRCRCVDWRRHARVFKNCPRAIFRRLFDSYYKKKKCGYGSFFCKQWLLLGYLRDFHWILAKFKIAIKISSVFQFNE